MEQFYQETSQCMQSNPRPPNQGANTTALKKYSGWLAYTGGASS